jgi:hypothetical protein
MDHSMQYIQLIWILVFSASKGNYWSARLLQEDGAGVWQASDFEDEGWATGVHTETRLLNYIYLVGSQVERIKHVFSILVWFPLGWYISQAYRRNWQEDQWGYICVTCLQLAGASQDHILICWTTILATRCASGVAQEVKTRHWT